MLSLIKYFSFVLLIFYPFNLLAFNNSDKEEWHEIVKQYFLDYETGLNEYKNKNYNKAFKIFLTLANSGDARAQSDIAGMYFNGWGVEVDYKKAFQWYEKASKMEIHMLNISLVICIGMDLALKLILTQHKFGGKRLLITDIRMPNLIYHISTVI